MSVMVSVDEADLDVALAAIAECQKLGNFQRYEYSRKRLNLAKAEAWRNQFQRASEEPLPFVLHKQAG